MFTFPEKEHLTEERRLPQTNAKVKTHQKKRIRNYKSSPPDLFEKKKSVKKNRGAFSGLPEKLTEGDQNNYLKD